MHTHQFKNTGKTAWLITVIVISLYVCATIQAQDTTDIPVWISDSVSKNVRDYNEIIKKIYAIVVKDIRIIQAGSVSYNAAVYPVFAFVYTPPVQPAVRYSWPVASTGMNRLRLMLLSTFFSISKLLL